VTWARQTTRVLNEHFRRQNEEGRRRMRADDDGRDGPATAASLPATTPRMPSTGPWRVVYQFDCDRRLLPGDGLGFTYSHRAESAHALARWLLHAYPPAVQWRVLKIEVDDDEAVRRTTTP
jgi:hypothetical protein